MEGCLGPVWACLKWLWPFLAPQLSYIIDLKKNFNRLKNEVAVLCHKKEDIKRGISRDRSKVLTVECQAWVTKVEQLVNEVELIEQEINANRKCLNVCCFPDIFLRKKLGKRVKNMLDNDVTILKQVSIYSSGTTVVDASQPKGEKKSLPTIVGETINHLVQNMLTFVSDDNIQKIGLWGMGGVGKTTAMMKLNNELIESNGGFDFVIWVTVSNNWTVKGVQTQIMEQLGMTRMDTESDESVASKLLLKLVTIKYLLLLDDVWSQVDLESVGIPMPHKKNGSKIVLTTRYLSVCKKMGTDADIKVEVLSPEEAWMLFRETVGDIIDSPSIEPIARQVVEECDGLPLVVIVIGGPMRKVEEVHAWETALDELRSASSEINDMEGMVFDRLKFSYDRLKSDNLKNCFLYCALYPEDYKIPVDELVKQWRDEGFIEGMKSLEKAYKKGLTIKDGLIGDSLLERADNDVDGNECVKMHDVMRDLALRITSPRFLVQAGVGIKECEHVEEWEAAERISLMKNSLRSLPASPTCNSLCTLLLQQNKYLVTIPKLFFQHMPKLRVVNLNETAIRVLPPSVSNLVNLQALYLSKAVIKVLPPSVSNLVNLRALYLGQLESLPSEIGGLKRLEVLHIGRIVSLPLEVRELSSLRSLRVGFGRKGEETMRMMCRDGVISCLCLLEDLRFLFAVHDDSLCPKWDEMVNVGGMVEVGSLRRLTSLMFEFPTTEYLDELVKIRSMMNHPEFTQAFLSIKGFTNDLENLQGRLFESEIMGKQLIWGLSGESSISSGMIELFRQGFEFKLRGHETVEKLSDFGVQKLNQLQSCTVEDCLAMESIVSVADGIGGTIVLPNLQTLHLTDLPNLRSICDDSIPPPPPSFTALRKLSISHCGKLRSVFTRSMIQRIPNLEVLSVKFCSSMEEIVGVREVEDQVVDDAVLFFPRLKQLELKFMRNLERIWKGVSSQPWPSLEVVDVYVCQSLKTLNLKVMDNDHHNASSSSSSSLRLREIHGEREWWEALEWEHNDDHRRLQPLFKKYR